MGVKPEIVTGHDFRSYSGSIKLALVTGLMAAGAKVHDIGLAVTPMAYFAQFDLDVPAVAMVTASHNENGWTGVKMGAARPLTFGPDEMGRLRDIVLSGSRRSWPAATARPAPSPRGHWRRSAWRSCRSTPSSTTVFRATIRTPKT
jgi:phosphomannomutase